MRARMKRNNLLLLTALLACGPAWGALPQCRVSASGIAFGPADAARQSLLEATGTVTLSCEGGGAADLQVELAPSPGGARGEPEVRVFLDPAHRIPWGDGQGGSSLLTARVPGDARPVHVPVYARLAIDVHTRTGPYLLPLVLVVHVTASGLP